MHHFLEQSKVQRSIGLLPAVSLLRVVSVLDAHKASLTLRDR
jgi:hypothetical protein